MDYTITNVKVSVKCPALCLDTVLQNLLDKEVIHKRFLNYLVIQNVYTYVLFKTNRSNETNHVNITKIPRLDQIEHAKEHLCELLNLKVILLHVVDNITVSTKLHRSFLPCDIITLFKDRCIITFNQETFPGIFLKFPYGTAIIFHTGRCILIGCKTVSNIVNILNVLKEVTTNQNGQM